VETLSLVLLLVAFPVISLGSTHGQTAVWVIGFAALVLGGVLPVWTRYMNHDNDKVRDMGTEFDDRTS
jgi:hypothetical protein